jgi:rhomboid protease GluP
MVKKVFVENYLTRPHFSGGLLVSFGMLALCFVLSALQWNGYIDWMAKPNLVFADGDYWRLVTSIFVHGDLKHLLSNSVMTLVMGYYVSSYFGVKAYPLFGLFVGSVINFLVLMTFKHEIGIVGISGVLYYLWGFWFALYIKLQSHISLTRRLMKVFIVGSFLLIPEVFEVNVSHLSHFLGFVLGILLGIFYYWAKGSWMKSHEKWELQQEKEVDFDYSIREEDVDHYM